MKPFIIIGHGRSGTVMLQTSLNNHPDITCYPEMLSHVKSRRIRYQNKFFNENNNKWIEYNSTDYILKNLFKDGIGFKILLHQISFWNLWNFFSKSNINFLYIKRNPIVRYVSGMQARKSGIWYIDQTKPLISIEPIKIEVSDFLNDITYCESLEKNLKYLKNIHEIEYKEFVNNYDNIVDGIFDYLDVERFRVKPNSQKINSLMIEDRVTNWQDFSNYIADTSYSYLLKDLI